MTAAEAGPAGDQVGGSRRAGAHTAAPGTEPPRRFRPKLRYELIDCGLHGHELLGTDAAELRPADSVFTRDAAGLRWYRCLRCDAWVALPRPRIRPGASRPTGPTSASPCGAGRCATGTCCG